MQFKSWKTSRLKLLSVLLLLLLLLRAAVLPAEEPRVSAPPAELKLDSLYTKYVSANGYPIVASAKVSDYALLEAAYLVDLMLAERADVRKAMIESGSRLIVMGHAELTTDFPEYKHLKPK